MWALGYAVLQFSSAEAFLKSDQWHDADCLISDVQMPGMNGVDLQGKLIDQGHRLPIIFVTGSVGGVHGQKSRAADHPQDGPAERHP